MNWKGLARAAAMAVLACGSAAYASENQAASFVSGGGTIRQPCSSGRYNRSVACRIGAFGNNPHPGHVPSEQ